MKRYVDPDPPFLHIVVSPAAVITITAGLLWLGISIILAALMLRGGDRAQAAEEHPLILRCEVISPSPSPSAFVHLTPDPSNLTPDPPSERPNTERGESPTASMTESLLLDASLTPSPSDLTPNPSPNMERGESTLAGIFQTATFFMEMTRWTPPTPTPVAAVYVIAPRGLSARPCPRLTPECQSVRVIPYGRDVTLTGKTVIDGNIVWAEMWDGYWIARSANGVQYLGEW